MFYCVFDSEANHDLVSRREIARETLPAKKKCTYTDVGRTMGVRYGTKRSLVVEKIPDSSLDLIVFFGTCWKHLHLLQNHLHPKRPTPNGPTKANTNKTNDLQTSVADDAICFVFFQRLGIEKRKTNFTTLLQQ